MNGKITILLRIKPGITSRPKDFLVIPVDRIVCSLIESSYKIQDSWVITGRFYIRYPIDGILAPAEGILWIHPVDNPS